QARVNHLTNGLMHQAAVSRELQQAALEARIILNELISTDRDIRLAKTPSDVNFVLQHLKNRGTEANAAYESAIALATLDEDKQFLNDAKKAFNEYVAAAQEIAALQYDIIELRDQQISETQEWSKISDGLLNGKAISIAPNRYALESNLQQANSEFMRAASISWSRFVRSDNTQIKRIYDAL